MYVQRGLGYLNEQCGSVLVLEQSTCKDGTIPKLVKCWSYATFKIKLSFVL